MHDSALTSRHQDHIADIVGASLESGSLVRFRVLSSSMAPLIAAGDWVRVRGSPVSHLGQGDIVCCRRDRQFVVHRLLFKPRHDGTAQLLTKGDASGCLDPAWAPDELVGLVVAVEKDRNSHDLENWPWRLTNRFVGYLFSLQVRLLDGEELRGEARGGPSPSWKRYLSRTTYVQGRLCLRLASRVL